MPPDIRSFFGGKGGQAGGASQEKSTPKKAPPEKQSKSRGKRKVVSDSDDDVDAQSTKKATPKKDPPKKPVKRDSPAGEVTTTSDYFAASGKSKPTRSTPSKTKGKKDIVEVQAPSTKSTPKGKAATKPDPPTNGKTSSRKKSKPNYVVDDGEDDEDDDDGDAFEPKMIGDDEESGEDLFEADFRGGRRGGKDAYESDGAHEIITQPKKKSFKGGKKPQPVKPAQDDEDSDIQMLEIPMNEIPQYKEPKGSKSANGTNGVKGRKRKSAALDDDEDDFLDNDDAPASKKAKATKAKSPAKKATLKKKKEEEPRPRAAVDDILDSISTVRAPTPPPRDPDKKFDWKAAQGHTQGPSFGGAEELPTGAENCLAGLVFVFTGVLETLQRETGQELVKRHGGKVTGAPSKKTNFVVLGEDAGPKKLETIKQYSIRTINEQGLFELIRKLPANGGDGKAGEEYEAKAKKEADKVAKEAKAMEEAERTAAKEEEARENAKLAAGRPASTQQTSSSTSANEPVKDSRLWTVKYAPTATSMICGNQALVQKLQAWLRAWPENVARKFRMGGKDGFGAFRAMCLHGPPGIGKTTAAHLAAKLEGYDVVESNASDTRSKKLVETGLRGVLDTTSLLGYFAGDGQKVESGKKKLVLIMDEVDGMSAGDRGGVGALAAVCRKSTVPLILICNDRKLPKMKPFDSVAYDLPFRRPTIDQIRGRIMTICFREGLKIPAPVINALIEGSRADIRQVINMLSTAKLDFDQEGMDFDKGKKMSEAWQKNIILKPWDIVNKILSGGMFAQSSTSTLNDKIELYFNDHEFSSLMLQENYLGTSPMLANTYSGKERQLKQLELVDQAAQSISDGDLVDRMIHGSQQQWSLMPTHAVFSFVRPASFMSGSMAGNQTRFTSWLGNNSKLGKLSRLIKEIQGHMRLHSSGDRHEIRQQYLPLLWYRLIEKLRGEGKEAIDDMIALMDSYYLTKDDWDAILELGVGEMDMEKIKIDTQTKSAFTRNYNLMSHPLPYMKASSIVAPKKKGKERPDLEEALDESDSGADTGDDQAKLEDDEPLDLKKDKYVKAPKKKAAKAAAKGKAAGKGKGKVKKEDEDDELDDEEEDVKPKKGKAMAKAKK